MSRNRPLRARPTDLRVPNCLFGSPIRTSGSEPALPARRPSSPFAGLARAEESRPDLPGRSPPVEVPLATTWGVPGPPTDAYVLHARDDGLDARARAPRPRLVPGPATRTRARGAPTMVEGAPGRRLAVAAAAAGVVDVAGRRQPASRDRHWIAAGNAVGADRDTACERDAVAAHVQRDKHRSAPESHRGQHSSGRSIATDSLGVRARCNKTTRAAPPRERSGDGGRLAERDPPRVGEGHTSIALGAAVPRPRGESVLRRQVLRPAAHGSPRTRDSAAGLPTGSRAPGVAERGRPQRCGTPGTAVPA